MRKSIVLMLVLISGCFFMTACNREEKVNLENDRPAYVKSYRVKDNVKESSRTIHGTVKENQSTTLSFRVGGPINSLRVDVGDYVKKGSLIASIDKRDYKIQLRQTEAQLNQISGEFGRYKKLFEAGKLPENNYEKIKAGLELATVAYDNAKNQLRDTELRAPISGYVSAKMTNNFQTVGPGTPIVSIIDISSLDVVCGVSSTMLDEVSSTNAVLIDIPTVNLKGIDASLISVSKSKGADGLFQVKYRVAKEAISDISQARAGMAAEIVLNKSLENSKISIPTTSLFSKGGESYVWKIVNGKAKASKVIMESISQTGSNNNSGGNYITVRGGVTDGDIIITAGVNSLIDGESVQVVKEMSETNIGGVL